MVLGRPLVSSVLLHLGVLLALWVGFAPKAFDSMYLRPLWVETDRAEISLLQSQASGRRNLARPSLKPEGFSASRELRNLGETEAAPAIPTQGKAFAVYNEYQSKVRSHLYDALEIPWSLQRASLQRRGVSGRVILRITFNDSGQFVRSEIVQSSGFAQLDLLASEASRAASPYPAPDPVLQTNGQVAVILSVEFPSKLP